MRKLMVTALVVFAIAATFGVVTGDAAAIGGGGGGNCYYTCTCAGVPLYCCVFNGMEFCSVTNVIQCTQVYNC